MQAWGAISPPFKITVGLPSLIPWGKEADVHVHPDMIENPENRLFGIVDKFLLGAAVRLLLPVVRSWQGSRNFCTMSYPVSVIAAGRNRGPGTVRNDSATSKNFESPAKSGEITQRIVPPLGTEDIDGPS